MGCGTVVQQIWASRVVEYIMEHHCFVIDLREPKDFRRGHLPKAVQMDADEISEGNYEFPKDLPIVVYCEGGSVSLRIARLLSMRGYHVYNLAGGYDAYLRMKK